MPKYVQTVRFEREIVIEAPNAARANQILEDKINESEFHGDVREDGHYEFEDEPVECPKCKGRCFTDDDQPCDKCDGDGSVPFGTDSKP